MAAYTDITKEDEEDNLFFKTGTVEFTNVVYAAKQQYIGYRIVMRLLLFGNNGKYLQQIINQVCMCFAGKLFTGVRTGSNTNHIFAACRCPFL